jgi:hypothetical protein
MKKRRNLSSDQDQTEKAYEMLHELTRLHPEIEMTLWAGAFMSAFINMHMDSGLDYNDFCEVIDGVKAHYKKWYQEPPK